MVARSLAQRELDREAGGHLREAAGALCLADQLPAQLGDAEGDAEGNEVTLAGEVAEPLLDAGRVRQHGDPRAAPARLGQAELRGHPPLLPEGADIRGYFLSTVGSSTGAEVSAGTAAEIGRASCRESVEVWV